MSSLISPSLIYHRDAACRVSFTASPEMGQARSQYSHGKSLRNGTIVPYQALECYWAEGRFAVFYNHTTAI